MIERASHVNIHTSLFSAVCMFKVSLPRDRSKAFSCSKVEPRSRRDAQVKLLGKVGVSNGDTSHSDSYLHISLYTRAHIRVEFLDLDLNNILPERIQRGHTGLKSSCQLLDSQLTS